MKKDLLDTYMYANIDGLEAETEEQVKQLLTDHKEKILTRINIAIKAFEINRQNMAAYHVGRMLGNLLKYKQVMESL